jgi:hypothetical protein
MVRVTVPGFVACPDVLAIAVGVTLVPPTVTAKSLMVAVPDAIAVSIVNTNEFGTSAALKSATAM